MSFFGLTSAGAQNVFSFNRVDDQFESFKETKRALQRTRSLARSGDAAAAAEAAAQAQQAAASNAGGGDSDVEDEAAPGGEFARIPHRRVTQPQAREFKSASLLQEKRGRHWRSDIDPQDRFRRPPTGNSEYGWETAQLAKERTRDVSAPDATSALFTTKRFPRKSCAETRYASAMVASGP